MSVSEPCYKLSKLMLVKLEIKKLEQFMYSAGKKGSIFTRKLK